MSVRQLLSVHHRLLSSSRNLLSGSRQLLSVHHRLLSSSRNLLSGSRQLLSVHHRLLSSSHNLLSGSRQLSSGGRKLLSSSHNLLSGGRKLLFRGRHFNISPVPYISYDYVSQILNISIMVLAIRTEVPCGQLMMYPCSHGSNLPCE